MHKKYLIFIAALLLILAGAVDVIQFKKNGGHSGSSIVESGEEMAEGIAHSWVEHSAPTYVFDGMSIVFVDSAEGQCPQCSIFHFSFDSRHGGYGNREGLFVTQVITPHTIEVEIKNGKVIRAVTDGKYNEITGAFAQ